MTHYSATAWSIGILLAASSIMLVIGEEKVKRQLSSQEPLVTYQSVPKTSFSCDLVGPGYYADMETQCQIFHVCQGSRKDSFICPGGTAFNQRVFVCDWSTNVDCPSSRDFYSLNSRIGSDEPFHTDVFIGGRLGGSTNRRPGGSTDRLARIGSIPDGQLGSQSQARLKAVKPDGAKQSGKFDTSSNIRVGNTLLLNTLFVEVPRFVAKETEPSERPATEDRPSVEPAVKPPTFTSSRQDVLSKRREGDKRKNQAYGSRLREEGYLPESKQQSNKDEGKGRRVSLEGSGENLSEKDAYLPTDTSDAARPADRGSYLPEPAQEDSPPSSARKSYLPEEEPDSSNYLSEEPPQSTADTSFLQPPLSSPELPNSILDAFSLPEVDEYGPESPTTAPPRLPPMNLLPLSDEPPPPTTESRLPSTTESYGVLDEGEDRESSAPPADRRELGLTRRLNIGGGENEIEVERKTNQRPSEEPKTSETDRFQYDFDSVRNTLQDRLKNVEPFDVPADTLAKSDRTTVTPQRGSSGDSVALLAPWLFSLAEVPM
ncbi:uncharacterized protein LOC122388310 [Amphibalanus amphitrite]|uniref:uncharacterized protein LOC122388310 n=1 Tax=Amphibalanus amphitrite TaxID=1232801 RepID=UPI001C90CE68|nr:uncharacterized protein LOC122388310 [Amphibalanus amphitrite]XP_043235214.1 uncharacterized protein LOC122388310 [Amphibalanus amphitrite]